MAATATASGKPRVLTPRWYGLNRVEPQVSLWQAGTRFRVVPAGRRSGKTELGKRFIVVGDPERGLAGAMTYDKPFDDPWFPIMAPTHQQAKRIYWNDMKALIPKKFITKISESELFVRLFNGAEIQVIGVDKPERIEGRPMDGCLLDEYGNMKPDVWNEHVRPSLSTPGRPGWAWLIGVPEGRNHYWDLYKRAISGGDGAWSGHHWRSEIVVDPAEIEQARHDLDPLTFEQEYGGSFVDFAGRAYYSFGEGNVSKLKYDPTADLIVCFDFNVSPGVVVVCQEQTKSWLKKSGLPVPGDLDDEFTAIIGEVHIPRHSNTPRVCKKLVEDWGDHRGNVYAYGDATGGAEGTTAVMGSDWDLIDAALTSAFGERFTLAVGRTNPRERQRVNSLNSRCKAADGTIRLLIDEDLAPNCRVDLDGVKTLEGTNGEIDKKSDSRLTHMTDALGYYVHAEYPAGGVTLGASQV